MQLKLVSKDEDFELHLLIQRAWLSAPGGYTTFYLRLFTPRPFILRLFTPYVFFPHVLHSHVQLKIKLKFWSKII